MSETPPCDLCLDARTAHCGDCPCCPQPAAQGPEAPAARLRDLLLRALINAWHDGNEYTRLSAGEAQQKAADFADWKVDELLAALASPALPAEAPLETRLCSFCPDPVGPAYGSDDLKHTICHQCIEKAARFFRASASAVSLTAAEWDRIETAIGMHERYLAEAHSPRCELYRQLGAKLRTLRSAGDTQIDTDITEAIVIDQYDPPETP